MLSMQGVDPSQSPELAPGFVVGWGHVVSTVLLIGCAILVRAIAIRRIRSSKGISDEMRRRWIVQTRRGVSLAVVLGLVIVWASELRTAAISVVAIAVALVIATKELIMCVAGSILRASGDSFSVGDRIEVKGVRGDVIDHGFLTTTLLELGPGKLTHQMTGRAVSLPNSVFLTEPVVNETFTDDYVLHVFTIPVKRSSDWRRAERALMEVAGEQCRPYLSEAQRHLTRMCEELGLPAPSLEPRVSIQFPDADQVLLVVRLPVPARRKGRVEQMLLRRFAELTEGEAGAGAASDQA